MSPVVRRQAQRWRRAVACPGPHRSPLVAASDLRLAAGIGDDELAHPRDDRRLRIANDEHRLRDHLLARLRLGVGDAARREILRRAPARPPRCERRPATTRSAAARCRRSRRRRCRAPGPRRHAARPRPGSPAAAGRPRTPWWSRPAAGSGACPARAARGRRARARGRRRSGAPIRGRRRRARRPCPGPSAATCCGVSSLILSGCTCSARRIASPSGATSRRVYAKKRQVRQQQEDDDGAHSVWVGCCCDRRRAGNRERVTRSAPALAAGWRGAGADEREARSLPGTPVSPESASTPSSTRLSTTSTGGLRCGPSSGAAPPAR